MRCQTVIAKMHNMQATVKAGVVMSKAKHV